jgi:large subunit ribosomal protein L7e
VDCELIKICSVPTNDQILVPETLLKKRKSQEKARAERTDAVEKKKAVSTTIFLTLAL